MASNAILTYRDTLDFLLEFTDYEKITKYKYDIATFSLDRVRDLMKAAGSPHERFRSIHVAGTKGKGSTATMIQCVLTAAGFRSGLYTSPHLNRIEERMTVDGALMPERDLIEVVNALVPYTRKARAERPHESPTYFELVTAAGFLHFVRSGVDFGVVEVGLGGRLDATNVITPEVSVITRIDYDHVERLGHTLSKIAWEKAGIIKPGVPVVVAPQETEAMESIERVARERNAPLASVGRECAVSAVETGVTERGAFLRLDLVTPRRRRAGLELGLLGAHQAQNVAVAIAAVELLAERRGLDIGEDALRRGLRAVRLPARSEVFPGRPPVLLDGAHNPISIRALCATLDRVFAGRKITMVLGFSHDKDIATMLRDLLPRAAQVVFTRSDSPRAAETEVLVEAARGISSLVPHIAPDGSAALARARELADPDGLICVTGSFFLAGNVRPALGADP